MWSGWRGKGCGEWSRAGAGGCIWDWVVRGVGVSAMWPLAVPALVWPIL